MYGFFRKASAAGCFGTVCLALYVVFRLHEAGVSPQDVHRPGAVLLAFCIPWISLYLFCRWASQKQTVPPPLPSFAKSGLARSFFRRAVAPLREVVSILFDIVIIVVVLFLLRYSLSTLQFQWP